MKWYHIALVGLIVILAVFTTLYFASPRKVVVEKPVWESIPDEIAAQFKPAPPDTTWKISMEALIQRLQSLEEDVKGLPDYFIVTDSAQVPVAIDTLPDAPTEVIVSQKTFSESLISARDKPLVDVTSKVRAYSLYPVGLFENSITVVPHKENLIEEYIQNMPQPKTKFWWGVAAGVGAAMLGVIAAQATGVM